MFGKIAEEFSITLSFQIKNPSINNLKVIRFLVENIKSFNWINLEYNISEFKNNSRINSIKYSIDDREEILKKFHPENKNVIEKKE